MTIETTPKNIVMSLESNLDFHYSPTIFDFLIKCIMFSNENEEVKINLNILKKEEQKIRKINNKMNVLFYYKDYVEEYAEEEKKQYSINTIIEFQFKENCSRHEQLKELYLKLQNIDSYIEEFKKITSQRLICLYEKEKHNVKTFAEFVARHEEDFYTVAILQEVYRKASGLKSKFEIFYENLKSRRNIKLITKHAISKHEKALFETVKTCVEFTKLNL